MSYCPTPPSHLAHSIAVFLAAFKELFHHPQITTLYDARANGSKYIGLQELTRQNIRVNEQTIQVAGGSAAAQELSWGVTSVSQLPEEWQAPDTILAADVVYRQDLFQPLLHSLDKLCKYSGFGSSALSMHRSPSCAIRKKECPL